MKSVQNSDLLTAEQTITGFTDLGDAANLARTFVGLFDPEDRQKCKLALDFVQSIGATDARHRNIVFLRVLAAGQAAITAGASLLDVEELISGKDDTDSRRATEEWSDRLFPLPAAAIAAGCAGASVEGSEIG